MNNQPIVRHYGLSVWQRHMAVPDMIYQPLCPFCMDEGFESQLWFQYLGAMRVQCTCYCCNRTGEADAQYATTQRVDYEEILQ